jgi:hypothetical protein
MNENRDEHYDLFRKPKFHEMRAGLGSENTGLYKKYVSIPCNLDFVVEYFKLEDLKRRGFSSPFLTKNPYESHFSAFVEDFETKNAHLPPETSHARLIAALENKHQQALASLK